MRTAIVAALAREVAPLTRGERPDATLRKLGIELYRMGDAVVVAAGMGQHRVSLAVQAALDAGAVERLISVGLAGSCAREIVPGMVVEAGVVIEPRTGERFATELGANGPVLVSTESIASVVEKQWLAATYGAAMVDMEAATVARLARAHGLRFRAVKGISDAYDFELASLGRFTGRRGEFRTVAFAVHTALRPGTWGSTIQLGRNSGAAIAALGTRVREILGEA